jgi:hypothetical protein
MPRLAKFFDYFGRLTPRVWFAVVLGIGLLARLGLWALYTQPVAYSDTNSYRRSAEAILAGWDGLDGTRTPGYPLFLALVGPDGNVWLVQMALGLLAALLFFYIGWRISQRPWLGGLLGLAHSLNLGQLFFEANLLTETLTTFLLAVALAGVVWWWDCRPTGWRALALAAGLGLVSGAATLVRPLFIFMPVWLALAIGVAWPGWAGRDEKQPPAPLTGPARTGLVAGLNNWLAALRINLLACLAVLIPALLLIGAWVNFIHTHYHDWSLTVMNGYHLVQHTGNFFEYVPDEYAVIRDTYIKYRDAHIAEYGTQANTIWGAIPELQKVSGYGFYDLARILARISVQLILKHPGLYLRSVVEGWWWFWRAPVYWSAAALRWPALAAPLRWLILAERGLLFFFNLVFILASPLMLRLRWTQGWWLQVRRGWQPPAALGFLLSTVWVTSIVQTLLDHGDIPRFLVPLQTWVVAWGLWYFWQIIGQWWRRRQLLLRRPRPATAGAAQ